MKHVAATIALATLAVLLPVLTVIHDDALLTAYHESHSVDVNASAAQTVQSFVTGDTTDLPSALSERAASHLRDVRSVIAWSEAVAVIAALVSLAAFTATASFRWAAHLLLGVVVFVGAGFAAWFDAAFYVFHEAFFASGTYVFPPSSTLITWFPASFFKACASAIIVGWASLTAALHAVDWVLHQS